MCYRWTLDWRILNLGCYLMVLNSCYRQWEIEQDTMALLRVLNTNWKTTVYSIATVLEYILSHQAARTLLYSASWVAICHHGTARNNLVRGDGGNKWVAKGSSVHRIYSEMLTATLECWGVSMRALPGFLHHLVWFQACSAEAAWILHSSNVRSWACLQSKQILGGIPYIAMSSV